MDESIEHIIHKDIVNLKMDIAAMQMDIVWIKRAINLFAVAILGYYGMNLSGVM